MGPTAVGKTEIALRLARYYPIEIISVDSALIYRDLDIGSAKPNKEELKLVTHHLIDILNPLESYSVADFILECKRLVADINKRDKLPVLVGGTMMYYNALINGISQLPSADPQLRASLENDFAKFGNVQMHARLSEFDPILAARINVNDRQRIERALEVSILTGKPMSVAQKEFKLPGLVNCDYLALAIVPGNRALLHERINLRFENMLNEGFVAEVQQLQAKYPELSSEHNSMRSVGYRQVWDFLAGKINYQELLYEGQAATRQLAKRQITWLRSIPSIVIDDSQLNLSVLLEKILGHIDKFVKAG